VVPAIRYGGVNRILYVEVAYRAILLHTTQHSKGCFVKFHCSSGLLHVSPAACNGLELRQSTPVLVYASSSATSDLTCRRAGLTLLVEQSCHQCLHDLTQTNPATPREARSDFRMATCQSASVSRVWLLFAPECSWRRTAAIVRHKLHPNQKKFS
jgi:hypothetical protein